MSQQFPTTKDIVARITGLAIRETVCAFLGVPVSSVVAWSMLLAPGGPLFWLRKVVLYRWELFRTPAQRMALRRITEKLLREPETLAAFETVERLGGPKGARAFLATTGRMPRIPVSKAERIKLAAAGRHAAAVKRAEKRLAEVAKLDTEIQRLERKLDRKRAKRVDMFLRLRRDARIGLVSGEALEAFEVPT